MNKCSLVGRLARDPEVKYNAFWYRGYKGSHELNTAEMAKLIDGTVYECKEAGIETLTPNELERMKGLWHERN